MEFVLLWLDEIDDLVFATLAFWRRLAYPGLPVALAVAASLNSLSLLAIA